MISDKKGIQELAAIMLGKGITDVVISPGSRNAPLINTFAAIPEFTCYSVVDERSAAFFALGIAIKTGKTVALSCTSGTAALNYAPAIAEAYYQKVSLLVLTADRPVSWVDQADGQTIRQRDVFSQYIKKSYELPQQINTDDDQWFSNRIINQAINTAQFPVSGPVHINLPFTEPLYDVEDVKLSNPRLIELVHAAEVLDTEQKKHFVELINQSGKVMILAGQDVKNGMNELLCEISRFPQLILLSETNSNLKNEFGIVSIDRVLATIKEEEEAQFAPELLITFGNAIVSKRIKAFLRRNKAHQHIHINPDPEHPDTYQCLTNSVFMKAASFFKQIVPDVSHGQSSFRANWMDKEKLANTCQEKFFSTSPFVDLKVFEQIFKALPANCDLHMGNSSPVRYAQLFRHHPQIEHFCNRGTSGIDGSISTAVGVAWLANKLSVVIIGDLSFYYDSNALWNSYLSDKLRIIVINNGGGNIFRIIPGPAETEHLETFYETQHLEKTEGFARTFGLEYFHACNPDGLTKSLKLFLSEDLKKPALLEIFTNRRKSPEVLKNYFRYLKDQNPDYLY